MPLFDGSQIKLPFTLASGSNIYFEVSNSGSYIKNIVPGSKFLGEAPEYLPTASYKIDSASFDLRILSQSLSVSQSLQYTGRTPATRLVGGINIGDDLAAYNLGTLLEQIVAPYTAPTLTLISLLPSNSNYNQQNIGYSASFSWTQNVGTPAFTSGKIQYKRSVDSLWNDLTTAMSGSSNYKVASANVFLNSGSVNNTTVQFRSVFIDSIESTSSIASSTFSAYAAPTIVFSNTITPSLTSGGYMLRSLLTSYTTSVSGNITRNSPNINLSEYKIQRDYADNFWVDLNTYTSIATSGGVFAGVLDNTQPSSKNTIRFRALVKDSEVPSGQTINSVSSFNIYQPVLFGMSTATDVASVDLTTLTTVPHGSSSGQKVYINTSADKSVNGLTFTANSNRFCIACDNSYGNFSTFFDTGTNLNLISNFTQGTKSVTFADGTIKTYTVALYNLTVVSGTYTINIA